MKKTIFKKNIKQQYHPSDEKHSYKLCTKAILKVIKTKIKDVGYITHELKKRKEKHTNKD